MCIIDKDQCLRPRGLAKPSSGPCVMLTEYTENIDHSILLQDVYRDLLWSLVSVFPCACIIRPLRFWAIV